MDKALQTMIDNLPEKTGKSLDEWKTVLAKELLAKHGEMVKFLKSEHGVSHGFANTIVALYRADSDGEKEDLLALQYKGKEVLLPMYKKLDKILMSLGKDVKVTPKRGSVSYIRKHQFALVKPATKTRIDIGLKLKGIEADGILGPSGPFGTMCTHRIQVTNLDDIDAALRAWLERAYEMSE